ncbi:putative serine O-acetyltransferase [Bordetella holmesii 44057]|nr:putative serine O-acetyltransferase [Bordetella holmesii 44057]
MSKDLTQAHWNLDGIVSGLRAARVAWRRPRGRLREAASGGREFPSQESLQEIIKQLSGALFPMRLGPLDLREEVEDFYVGHTIGAALDALLHQVCLELEHLGGMTPTARRDTGPRRGDRARLWRGAARGARRAGPGCHGGLPG